MFPVGALPHLAHQLGSPYRMVAVQLCLSSSGFIAQTPMLYLLNAI